MSDKNFKADKENKSNNFLDEISTVKNNRTTNKTKFLNRAKVVGP